MKWIVSHALLRSSRIQLGALLTLASLSPTRASVVSFSFTGTVNGTVDPAGKMPSDIRIGAPVIGLVTYDTALAQQGGEAPQSPLSSTFYFRESSGFALAFSVAGHEFHTVSVPPGGSTYAISIQDGLNGSDGILIDNNLESLRLDGQPLPPGTANGWTLTLRDPTGTALSSDSLPNEAPKLASFGGNHRFEIAVTDMQGSRVYWFKANIEAIQAEASPWLNIRKLPDGELRLSWPLAARGFALQATPDPLKGSWESVATPIVDTELEHTCLTPQSAGPRYYRLRKP